jgi:D-arabinose 1-dehydrogenase-like Zn-dependent alcohol dehydrogenase
MFRLRFCFAGSATPHQVRNEWSGVMPTVYPCVPGQEIVGRVKKVEVIPIQKVNEAYERLLKADVKYRFSIDMASLKSA